MLIRLLRMSIIVYDIRQFIKAGLAEFYLRLLRLTVVFTAGTCFFQCAKIPFIHQLNIAFNAAKPDAGTSFV